MAKLIALVAAVLLSLSLTGCDKVKRAFGSVVNSTAAWLP